ncbi:MAG: sel1 repeat family protein [Gammaproteobacteria bacterium]|nr:sel1 repeat family protein [Gammaproteobacteria bacterium]
MMVWRLILIILLLSGCKTTTHQPTPDMELNQLIEQITQDPDSVSYLKFWNTYLQSSQAHNTGIQFEQYQQNINALEAGTLICTDIDWQALTGLNVWSINPHLTAAECYESQGLPALANNHNNIVSFLLNGVLSSKSGESFYSAYEVPTAGDAEDIIELSGYTIVDQYSEFRANRHALYYVIVANEQETNIQRTFYFDNMRLYHALSGVQFPFLGLDDQLYSLVLKTLTQSTYTANMAEAAAAIAAKEYNKAANFYLSAIAVGSAKANYELAKLCLLKSSELASLNKHSCSEFLIQAAELDLIDAHILLAYLYHQGIDVEPDKELSNELMKTISPRLEPGKAWYKLANYFYSGYLADVDTGSAVKAMEKSASQGNTDAKYFLVQKSYSDKKINKQQFTERLELLSKKGHALSQYILAMHYTKQQDMNLAKHWLEQAAEQGVPGAYFKLGVAYQFGHFGTKDLTKAFINYQEAAIRWYQPAQFKVGWFNMEGKAVYKDYNIALLWFNLCALRGNLDCIANIGYIFDLGLGVEQDHNIAYTYYKAAADKGLPRAQYNLGYLYNYGYGVDKDINQALEWYQKAAENGDAMAMNTLGRFYLKGVDVIQSNEMALEYFKKSSHHGHVWGSINLAEMHTQDHPQKAIELYKKAITQSNSLRLKIIFKCNNKLSSELCQSL